MSSSNLRSGQRPQRGRLQGSQGIQCLQQRGRLGGLFMHQQQMRQHGDGLALGFSHSLPLKQCEPVGADDGAQRIVIVQQGDCLLQEGATAGSVAKPALSLGSQ